MLYRRSIKRILLKLPEKVRISLIQNFPIIFFPPHMSQKEFKTFKRHASNANKIVEFGAGGSTLFFLNKGKLVFSVESDKSFYDFLKTFPLVKKRVKENLFYFYHINIGETAGWGKPKNEHFKENWSDYYKSVWKSENIARPDLIFIDGRFRVMCALYAISFIKKETKIMIHDFSTRKNYEDVFEFYDIVEQSESLIVLKIKEKINKEKLEISKKNHQLDYR